MRKLQSLFQISVLILLQQLQHSYTAKLPQFIKACKLSSPTLNQCALENGRAAIPYIVKGDPKYNLPSLMPLEIPEINIGGGQLKINLINCQIHGLETAQLKDITIDYPSQTVTTKILYPKFSMIGEYNINGRILVLPIEGHGNANLTSIDTLVDYSYKWSTYQKKGEEYFKVASHKLEFDLKRAYFQFDNLFNGDERLGTEMNNLLNTNWRDVINDLRPALRETFGAIYTTIISGLLSKVSAPEFFAQ